MSEENVSLWKATSKLPAGETLNAAGEIDVAIVGAGITGLTAALQLARAGRRVVVLDLAGVAAGETGRTTAHLTEAIDVRYPTLQRDFGNEGARLAAAGSREAIDTIEALVKELSIQCEFSRVPGFLYSERESDVEMLQDEARAASESGVAASFTTNVPLPFAVAGAVRYDNQAQFHPARYLAALAAEFTRLGGTIAAPAQVTEVHDGEPCTLVVGEQTIRARAVVVAANVPVNNRVFMHTKLAAYRTYAIAARVKDGFLAPGLFWDTDDPYHYTRMQTIDGESYLIVGGNDHKTGTKVDTTESYASLLHYAQKRFGIGAADFQWSGQIIEPVDGLPFIGRNSLSHNVYIATGYAGQGMTFGTLAGLITADLALGKENRYAELFAATRVKPMAAAVDYVTENVDFPKYFLSQHLTSFDVEGTAIQDVAPGQGKIIELEGKKVAAYREPEGALHLLSPVCPHLKCDVRFNDAETTWDCPCHGSRFTADGEVINGPATTGLEKLR